MGGDFARWILALEGGDEGVDRGFVCGVSEGKGGAMEEEVAGAGCTDAEDLLALLKWLQGLLTLLTPRLRALVDH